MFCTAERSLIVKTLVLPPLAGALFFVWATSAFPADKVSQVFIRDAIQINLAEIQQAQLAEENAQSADVKSFAKMLITDLTTINEQATKLAEQIGVAVPTDLSNTQRAIYHQMEKLSGAAFDRPFVRVVVADHKMNIPRYQNEAKKNNDPVADFANQTLPTLMKHLDAAQRLQSEP
jgi:putative membrane protein